MQIRYQKTLIEPQQTTSKVHGISWSPNCLKLAVATSDRHIFLFDECGEKRDKFSTKPVDQKYGKRSYVITAISFSPDSTKIAVGQSDCRSVMSNIKSGSIRVPPVCELENEPSTSFSKFRRKDCGLEKPSENVTEETVHYDNPIPAVTSASDESAFVLTVSKSDPFIMLPNSINTRSVTVSGRQKGNPLLRFLRNVPWEWGEISADYQISQSCCVLFLSVKFHKLNPEYIHQRFKKIGKSFYSQLLLVLVDIEEADNVLRELNTMCFLTACWTLILCWSYEECAEYIESLKIYENKPMEFLMTNENRGKEVDDRALLIDLLTSIRPVTKTDAENLIDAFGSLLNITQATVEQLALCRGIGLLKAQKIFAAFDQPFISKGNSNLVMDTPSEEHANNIMDENVDFESEDV